MKNWERKIVRGRCVSSINTPKRREVWRTIVWTGRGEGRRNDGRDERFGGRWPAVAGIRDFREALRDDGVGGGSTRDFGRGLGRACTVHGD